MPRAFPAPPPIVISPSRKTVCARRHWIAEALKPIEKRLSKPAYEDLLAGLSLLTGIEAIIVLRDVCAIDIDRAEKVVRWSAEAMLAKALAEAE